MISRFSKRMSFLLILALLSSAAEIHAKTISAKDIETEDYQILREIILVEFENQTPTEWGNAIGDVWTNFKTNEKEIALGVCPCDFAQDDAKLIKFLASENISATIFVCSNWIDKNARVIPKLAAEGIFDIANHGTTGKALSINGQSFSDADSTQSIEEVFEEIEGNARKIEYITGSLPQYYHSKLGYFDDVSTRIVRALGYSPIGSVDLTREPNPRNGSIVILEQKDNEVPTVENAIKTIQRLRKLGYRFTKLSNIAF